MKKALAITAIVLAVLLAISAAICLVVWNPVGKFLARGYVVLGDRLDREGDSGQARQMYDKAISSDPSNAANLIRRAALEYRYGQYKETAADASRAIELDPKGYLGWAWRGYAEKQLQQLKPAYDDFSKAIELNPQHATYRIQRSEVADKLDDFPDALADVQNVLTSYPKDPWAYDARAIIELDMNKLTDAEKDENTALGFDARAARLRVHLGWIKICEGNNDEAMNVGRAAVRDFPNDASAVFLLGLAHERKDDMDEAKDAFDRVLELDSKYNAHAQRGVAEYNLGQLDAAWSDFEAAKERADAKGKARLWLWIVDNERGHPQQADGDLAAWADSSDSQGQERRALAEMMLGRKTTQDLEAFAKSIKGPLRGQQFIGELWFFAGKVALIKGDKATALADFQKTLDSKALSVDEYAEAQREMKKLAAAPNVPAP